MDIACTSFTYLAAAATSAVAILRVHPHEEEEQGRGKRSRAVALSPTLPVMQLSSSWCVCIECSSGCSAAEGSYASKLIAHDLATIKGAKMCTLSRLSSYILQFDGGSVSLAALARQAPKPSFPAACAGALQQVELPAVLQRGRPVPSTVLDQVEEEEELASWRCIHGNGCWRTAHMLHLTSQPPSPFLQILSRATRSSQLLCSILLLPQLLPSTAAVLTPV
jgi:hypothetical protein